MLAKSSIVVLFLLIAQVTYALEIDTLQARKNYAKGVGHLDSLQFDSARHYLELAADLYKNSEVSTKYIECLNLIAETSYSSGNRQQAILEGEKHLAIATELLDSMDENLAASHFALATFYSSSGLVKDSYRHYAQSLSIRKQNGDSLLVATGYQGMGTFHFYAGLLEDAFTYFDSAYQIRLVKLGPDHPKLGDLSLNMAVLNSILGEFIEAEKLYKEALRIIKLNEGGQSSKIATIYNNMGRLYQQTGKFYKALQVYQSSIRIKKEKLGEGHPSTLTTLTNLATSYRMMGRLNDAERIYLKCLDLRKEKLGLMHPDVADSYEHLVEFYYNIRSLNLAMEYAERCMTIRVKLYGDTHPIVANIYSYMANIYQEMGEFSQAKILIKKALRNHNISTKIQTIDHSDLYRDLATVCKDLEQYDSAIVYYDKSLQALQATDASSMVIARNYYNGLANIYYRMEDYPTAMEYSDKAINIHLTSEEANDLEFALIYFNRSLYHFDSFQYDSSLFYINLSKEFLVEFDSLEQKNHLASDPILSLDILLYKLKCYKNLFEKENNPSYLQDAYHVIEEGNVLTFQIGLLQNNKNDQLEFQERFYDFYSLSQQLSLRHYSVFSDSKALDLAFQQAEFLKSTLLTKHLVTKDIDKTLGVPNDILDLRDDITNEISYLESQQLNGKTEASVGELEDLVNSLFLVRRKRDSLERAIKEQYPSYKFLLDAKISTTIPEVKNSLISNQALLEFSITDSQIYLYTITKEKVYVDSTSNLSQINTLVDSLHLQLTSVEADESVEQFNQWSHELYQLLLAKTIAQLPDHVNELIIIREGFLSNLPFELLLTSAPMATTFSKQPYLLKDYNIRYHYSANLFCYPSPKKSKDYKKDFIAFAPSFSEDSRPLIVATRAEIGDLLYNDKEVNGIKNYLEGDVYLSQQANEKTFKSGLADYRIIHLATHAFVNDTTPELSKVMFSSLAKDSIEDNALYMSEISNLEIPAELVVLSACNTAVGQDRKGEGMLSLGRAFTYAGSKAVIMSHWPVNDFATSQIMEYFYNGISNQATISTSLREAKLQYLENVEFPKLAHPKYWAAMTGVGDDTVLKEKTNYWIRWLLALAILVSGVWFVRKKRMA